VFHICTADAFGGLSKYSFLCPNGTIFNQNYFICDWWFNFDCSEAETLYSKNDEIRAEQEASADANALQPVYNSDFGNDSGASAPADDYAGAASVSDYVEPDYAYEEEVPIYEEEIATEAPLTDYVVDTGATEAPAGLYGAPAAPAEEVRDARRFRGGRQQSQRRGRQQSQRRGRNGGRSRTGRARTTSRRGGSSRNQRRGSRPTQNGRSGRRNRG
jgi:hypothetical protein